MRIFARALIFLILSANFLYPIPQEIENALKLNRINHFDEALSLIEQALKEEKIKPDITSAYTVGRILYRKGELYREMAKVGVLTHIGHLLEIQKREKVLPDELKVFLGAGYFFNSQFIEGAGILNQVVNKKNADPEFIALANVYLGACYIKTGDKDGARELWSRVGIKTIYAYSTLGFMYSYLRINPSEGEVITRNALEAGSEIRAAKRYINPLKVNHAFALITNGKFAEAYSLISDVNLDEPVYVFKPDAVTEIRFYDMAILSSYSKVLFGESIKNLEPVVTASSGELASFASYYISQMYLYLENYEDSLKFSQKAQKLAVSSSLTMIKSVACETAVYFLEGNEKKGYKLIEREIERIYGKPSLLLEMMGVFISSNVRYNVIKDIVAKVESYIYDTEWNRTRRDSALLGELSFYTGRYVRALYYLERARDKGNKNKIETNDPTFLLKLSYVYYSRDGFAESLEILFSLGKSFSGIRQIQDAVQSVYSYRQKGSGEALIE
ncbi:MAG: tetratricopeptide repeat protein [Spirochaetota bacterium]